MSLLVSIVNQRGVNESGNRRNVIADLAYTTESHSNGYAIPKEKLGFNVDIESLVFLNASPADTNQYKWDEANGTIRIYAEGAAVYVEVTSSLTQTIRVQAEGH